LLQKDLPFGLITNAAIDTRYLLGSLSIEQGFAAIGISAELGIAKPDARTFAFALEQLRVEPENVFGM
jgi:FMN phosphatase YigB (HAD superfamily)